MRLRTTLLQIAQLVIVAPAGCGGSIASSTSGADSGSGLPPADDGGEEASDDASAEGSIEASVDGGDASAPDVDVPEVACGGCGCGTGPAVPSGTATPVQACEITSAIFGTGTFGGGAACEAFCMQLGNASSSFYCTVPQGYVDAYDAANGDGGAQTPDGGPICPAWSSGVIIQCGYNCTGRSTHGVAEPICGGDETVGAMLAERAHLEAVAVHAFDTLERELAAHGAPASLLHDVRRARRDEVRHTTMMSRLARRYGRTPRGFAAPPPAPVRSLLAIALENAVEGCVRETYGAVVGLVEARASRDAAVRRTMRGISADECRHAELASSVAAWLLPRLTEVERADVEHATRGAVATLEREGEPGIVQLLAERVWNAAPGSSRA